MIFGSQIADICLSVPQCVKSLSEVELVHNQQLLAFTLDSMPGEAVEDGYLAVWVVYHAIRDGTTYLADLFEVRFVLNLEQVLLAHLVEVNKSVTPECIQEKSDVF